MTMDLRETGWGWGLWTGSTGTGQGPVANCCEWDDEPSGSCVADLVRFRMILRRISYYFLKKPVDLCNDEVFVFTLRYGMNS
jgi:hypothetical protein